MKSILAIILGLLSFLPNYGAILKSELYPMSAIVTQVDYEEDAVTFKSKNGHEWIWYGTEDWQVGDNAALIMNNNGTQETILDDIIVVAKYEN